MHLNRAEVRSASQLVRNISSLFCSMQRNPILYLQEDFAHIRSMMSRRGPLFGPHSLSMNPSKTRATAGGSKNQPRSPPSAATIGAAARRLGKVWQLKSIQGSVKHRPCVSCLTHQWGGGDRDGHERERNMFGLQISQNIGNDPWWGVRKRWKNFLRRWRWWYSKAFTKQLLRVE